jgi:hypothetical protein
MTDDIINLLVITLIIGHETFLEFHLGAKRAELLNEPYGTLHVGIAVWHTRSESHLSFDIRISAIGRKGRTGSHCLLFSASGKEAGDACHHSYYPTICSQVIDHCVFASLTEV